MAIAGVGVSVSPGVACARVFGFHPFGCARSDRPTCAEISGVVINADGTIREMFDGSTGTWTGRFRVHVTKTMLAGWIFTGTISGTVRGLIEHYWR